jgi:hypothetical protein
LHNVLYDKGQQKKKTAIEQEVTQSPDYEDLKKQGAASFANSFNTLPALGETAVNDVKQKLGAPYEKPDPYTPLQKPVVVKHAQRDFATRNLDPKAKLLANGVLDLTEFGVKAMVPVIGLPWASASAASETASDALVQGDTPEGAMKKAVATGLETWLTGKAAEGLLKNAGGFIKDAKGGKIGAAGEKSAAGTEGAGDTIVGTNHNKVKPTQDVINPKKGGRLCETTSSWGKIGSCSSNGSTGKGNIYY